MQAFESHGGEHQARYSQKVTDTSSSTFCLPPIRRGEAEFSADLEARIGSHLKAAEQALMTAKTDALRPFGLTVAQYAVLVALYYVPGQSSAQLARTAAVTPQTMTQTLVKLEQKHLIERVVSPIHNRVLVTTLTSSGEELVLKADEAARAIEQRLVDEFTAAERTQLTTLLARATAAFRGTGV